MIFYDYTLIRYRFVGVRVEARLNKKDENNYEFMIDSFHSLR